MSLFTESRLVTLCNMLLIWFDRTSLYPGEISLLPGAFRVVDDGTEKIGGPTRYSDAAIGNDLTPLIQNVVDVTALQNSSSNPLVRQVWGKHVCPLCGRVYTRKDNLNRHIAFQHEGRGKSCTICGEVLRDASQLKEHFRSRHSLNTDNSSTDITQK